MKKKILSAHKTVVSSSRSVYKRITRTIIASPAKSFFGVLGTLFLIIIIGSWLGKPKAAKVNGAIQSKPVNVYTIGTAPRVNMTAQVESSGVVKIIAQTSGIVQQVYVTEGTSVSRGTQLMWLSTNYQGGTLPSTARQIAQKNADFVNENYDAQKDLIARQKAIADDSQELSGDARAITNNSISDTKNLINLNQQVVDSLASQITSLEADNADGSKNSLIIQSRQGLAGAQSAINSLRVALANAEYQADSSNPPATLANASHDVTIAQLNLQEKSLDLNKEIAGLNLRIAQISEALMYPASPVDGVVERVYVQPGANVSSGTVLATITGSRKASSIVLLVPETTAKNISRIDPSTIIVGSQSFDMTPRYISTQPTDGSLYSVVFGVPKEWEASLASGSTVSVRVAIGAGASPSSVPFVPIDALYQTQKESYVYIASPSAEGKYTAMSLPVKLGLVFGQYVEVLGGLPKESHIITSRSVMSGDLVTIE